MTYSHYDRLTALDASFLGIEDPNCHMHVGSVGIFDAGPLRGADGGLDMERIMSMADAILARQPRFRQKLAYVPLLGSPVWVDDERFNLSYHVRHAALPPPGDDRQLKRLAGRIMSQQLDRGKPLWELWYVEGLSGDRFAVITKIHHCMVDGVAGADLMAAMMGPDPHHVPSRTSGRWVPRPAPSPLQLLSDETLRRAALPLDLARGAGTLVTDPRRAVRAVREAVGSVGEVLRASASSATPTPLNCAIGPHRRFDWVRLDLDTVKAIKNRLGATINDVVLAIVAGALRRFLAQRGEPVDDLTFRAMIPVSVRQAAEHKQLGNRVSLLVAPLPLGEPDPVRRLQQVVETMRTLKGSSQRRGTELLEEVSDRLSGSLLTQFARLTSRALPYNVVVTNVPGPPIPVYMLGAPLREVYPLVPLFANQGLGIALFSYDAGLFWGFNADWDALPDLHDLVGAVATECEALQHAAASASPLARAARERGARDGRPAPATKRRAASPLTRRRRPAQRGRSAAKG